MAETAILYGISTWQPLGGWVHSLTARKWRGEKIGNLLPAFAGLAKLERFVWKIKWGLTCSVAKFVLWGGGGGIFFFC